MTKRMLVDATHPEETRVAIVDDRRLEDFDFESASKKQLKGNIYLAKVIRIEPSLQAAFVEYGGNRHGFLPFSEIHPDYFRIPVGDRPHDEDDIDAEDENDDDVSSEALAEELIAYQNEPIDHDDEHGHVHASVPVAADLDLPKDEAVQPVDAPPEPAEIAETSFDEAEQPVETVVEVADGVPPVLEPRSHALGEDGDEHSGLITDFGNAIVDPVFVPAPVETVGGQGGEEDIIEIEESRRRRPRMPRYKIQEVIKRRQIMLIQVVKEERGNKGAALTTFLSLAGRYCVLMPNTDRGGGVSRKITSHQDRRRMKEILDQLETPEGMAVILRTAGMEQEPAEIQRDLEHLLRLWNMIREQTLVSTAPTLIYEEANLIKRSIRDLYSPNVAEVLVAGAKGYELAHDFMRSIMPEAQDRVKLYEDPVPLFFRYSVEKQIDQLYNPVVQLRSGGYIVINPTEALVSIDVNSGRATRERHIEGTALKTNLEAADEIARQLRLRDLAGLVVIDFIDMEDGRNNAAVERRMKEAMKSDRARLQIGRLSAFGLMELSRQRLHPSLTEINFERCPHCAGTGLIRTVDSSAISILRQIEEDAIRQPGGEMVLHVPTSVALYILNQKRSVLHGIEKSYAVQVFLHSDDTLVPPDCRLERSKGANGGAKFRAAAVDSDQVLADSSADVTLVETADIDAAEAQPTPRAERSGRRRGRYGRGRERPRSPQTGTEGDASLSQEPDGNVLADQVVPDDNIGNVAVSDDTGTKGEGGDQSLDSGRDSNRQGGRRRGRRGGRNRRGGHNEGRFEERQEAPLESASPIRHDVAPSEPRPAFRPLPIPISVHDLDTTPRDPREPAAPMLQNAPHRPTTFAPPRSPYEVTDLESDKPKGGWWRKLTGQE